MAICITLAERKSSRAGSPPNPYPLNDPDEAEVLAFGGLPPLQIITDVRALWWRLRAQGVSLPAERRVILLEGSAP